MTAPSDRRDDLRPPSRGGRNATTPLPRCSWVAIAGGLALTVLPALTRRPGAG